MTLPKKGSAYTVDTPPGTELVMTTWKPMYNNPWNWIRRRPVGWIVTFYFQNGSDLQSEKKLSE